jgi:hypothetical protein
MEATLTVELVTALSMMKVGEVQVSMRRAAARSGHDRELGRRSRPVRHIACYRLPLTAKGERNRWLWNCAEDIHPAKGAPGLPVVALKTSIFNCRD